MHNLTVKAKLILTLGIMSVLMAAMGISSLLALDDANARLVSYVSGVNARATLAEEVRDAVARRAVAARNLVLVTSPQDRANEERDVQKAQTEVDAKLAQLLAMATEARLPPEVLGRIKAIAEVEAKYGPVAQHIVKLAIQGQQEAAVASMNNDCRPLLKALMSAVDLYIAKTQEQGREMIADAEAHYAQQRLILLSLGVVALLSAAGLGWALVRSILAALGSEPNELNAVALQVARGDLSPITQATQAPANSVMAALRVRLFSRQVWRATGAAHWGGATATKGGRSTAHWR